MPTNAIRQLFWVVQFVFCIAISWTMTLDESCPCRPFNECSDDSQNLFKNRQMSMLPCESEHLTRCCSIPPKPVESSNTSTSSQMIDRRNEVREKEATDAEIDLSKTLTSLGRESKAYETSGKYSGMRANVSSLVKSTDASESSSKTIFHKDLDKTSVEAVGTKAVDRATENKVQEVDTETLDAENKLLQRRMFNEIITNLPSIVGPPKYAPWEQQSTKYKEPEIKESDELAIPEVASSAQIGEEQFYVQDLIDEVTSFESFRTSPKKLVSFLGVNSRKQEEQKLEGNIHFMANEKLFLNPDYRSSVNLKPSSIAKGVPEKLNDPFEQKTSLGMYLTLNGTSTRAIDENASKTSRKLDDDTFRDLSISEDEENVKRVVRSHTLELEEKLREDEGNFDPSMKRDRYFPVRGFKRPPRVLPIKNLQNKDDNTIKFASSRERAISLFNKSNETRRKQVFLLINKNDLNSRKLNSMNNSLLNTKELVNKNNDFGGNEISLLVEEKIARSDNKNIVDSKGIL